MDRDTLHIFLNQASLAERAHAIAQVPGAYDRKPTATILQAELERLGVWGGAADDQILSSYILGGVSASDLEAHFNDRVKPGSEGEHAI